MAPPEENAKIAHTFCNGAPLEPLGRFVLLKGHSKMVIYDAGWFFYRVQLSIRGRPACFVSEWAGVDPPIEENAKIAHTFGNGPPFEPLGRFVLLKGPAWGWGWGANDWIQSDTRIQTQGYKQGYKVMQSDTK